MWYSYPHTGFVQYYTVTLLRTGMSTSKKNLLWLVLLCGSHQLIANPMKYMKPKKAPVRYYQVKAPEKERSPLVFSIKNQHLKGPEKKIVLKKYRAIDKKPLKLMNEKELRTIANLALKLGWQDEAVKFLTRLMSLLKSTVAIKNIKLEIADINFDRNALKLAAREYEEFLKLYPGDKKAEYAQYKGLLSHFYTMLSADRDQTPTLNTIKLADAFLEKSDTYKQFNNDVKAIKERCYYALYDHEVTVFEYYMKKGSPKAAETRLANLKTSYQTLLPDTQPKNLHMEYRVALAKNDTVNAEKVHKKLASLYPNYTQKLAHKSPIKKAFDYVSLF